MSPLIERFSWRSMVSRRTENIEAIRSFHPVSVPLPSPLAPGQLTATGDSPVFEGYLHSFKSLPLFPIKPDQASNLASPTTEACTPAEAPPESSLPMCIYIQTIPLCGHPPPTLLAYASCNDVLAQLMRITEPEAWEPESIGKVPFDMPDDCDPSPDNIYVLYSDDYCGWECRNNAYQMAAGLPGFDEDPGGLLPACFPGDERGQFVGGRHGGDRRLTVVGMPDAKYGPGNERLGIGWRSL